MMREALLLAQEAAAEGEVPVGCVITLDDRIVGRGRNRRETNRTALAHAEIEAIAEACRTLGGWRLWQCTLYVTLEPCPMCAGAAEMSGLARVVYGARDAQYGCCGSVYRLTEDPAFPTYCPADGGVLADECAALVRQFFQNRRVSHEK